VELIEAAGDDQSACRAARVSTGADLAEHSDKANAGLIGYLVQHRHGSPFEHNLFTFRIAAPIFVFREFMRHRIGFSYNEISGRYAKLAPKFYAYPEGRPLVQAGSSAHPDLSAGDAPQAATVAEELDWAYTVCWDSYERMLAAGIANEVARAVLPVGIFSEMYVTCNARSLMAFLSLRIDSPDNQRETKPQWEIQNVAEQMEAIFAERMPATHAAFVRNGRVAP